VSPTGLSSLAFAPWFFRFVPYEHVAKPLGNRALKVAESQHRLRLDVDLKPLRADAEHYLVEPAAVLADRLVNRPDRAKCHQPANDPIVVRLGPWLRLFRLAFPTIHQQPPSRGGQSVLTLPRFSRGGIPFTHLEGNPVVRLQPAPHGTSAASSVSAVASARPGRL
jgi:hypothetical protein